VSAVKVASVTNGNGLFAPPLASCPRCGAPDLEAVSDGELTNFFCGRCMSCWHVELGYAHRVDVSSCPGCEHRPACVLSRAVADAESNWLGEEA
jgi:hypothetical protein